MNNINYEEDKKELLDEATNVNKLSDQVVRLRDLEDQIKIKEEEPEGVKKSNFGGWQSGNYKKFPEAFKLIGEKINSTIMNCAKQINVPELSLGSYWCNVNTYGDYNKLHNHRGSILSGVFYVDVPD